MLEINKVHNGDCLELMKDIETGSVDLILCDPPYGIVKNIGSSNVSHGMTGKTSWDEVIDTEKLFIEYERILRENGTLILFSQEPYTSKLRTYNQYNLEFSYSLYWKKDHFANALIAKKAPVSYVEDISVFHKKYDTQRVNDLRNYFEKLHNFIGLPKAEIVKMVGQKVDHVLRYGSTQFKLCKKETYIELIEKFNIHMFEGFKTYEELEDMNNKYAKVFNLKDSKFKSNILEYKKDYDGFHPTQKPVSLFEDLINTYTDEGSLVLDNCSGSGTTAIACININRNFICIEKDIDYFNKSINRVSSHKISC